MMLQTFQTTSAITFDHLVLQELAPCFDLDFAIADSESKQQWFRNLFKLAQQNLSLAHCIHHNHTARLAISVTMSKTPEFFQQPYHNVIGCYCGFKDTDTIQLDHCTVTGTKQWISLVDKARYGVFRIRDQDQQLQFVLIDFEDVSVSRENHSYNPIGMKLARPGSFTVDQQILPEEYVLMPQSDPRSFVLSNFHDYCFITNYLGCATALLDEIVELCERKNLQSIELDQLRRQLGALQMLWVDNIKSIEQTQSTDEFWHRRNTQYVQGKALIVDLVKIMLTTGSSYHLDCDSAYSQRFRDALMLCNHMKSVADNTQNLHFYKISL